MDNNRDNSKFCSCDTKFQTLPLMNFSHSFPSSDIFSTTGKLEFKDRFDHFLARLGIDRMNHVVKPGLYKLGDPDKSSDIIVSANYKLSFDAVRDSLQHIDCYILVLDTKGINVWCAAGKGTFGTDELVKRIRLAELTKRVEHRRLIVPQLGAPGISAHEVFNRSGFKVEYGPIKASDLPEYLKERKTTPEMRKVKFPLKDRLILIPIELTHLLLPTIVLTLILYFFAGPLASLAVITTVLAGTVLFPTLLPFIPTSDFTTKGFILGIIVAIPFSILYLTNPNTSPGASILGSIIPLLIIPSVTAYITLNFTGATPLTSKSGVKKEIYRYIPILAFMGGTGIILLLLLGTLSFLEVI